ncbi:adenine-specific DNA-methyltransferase [Algoriphagus locisalis]|uniref:site-specific DNA-methyltransferase (adenine-specific) n=1 Tax=Algoriphagus locisalis TaxID=305507 RepID=A0A1I7A895_9BACT|nr:site-specific DNA-methyltransferase [Algoriphagus locisalis]SFT71117.1 adenine-specific DNA-methyltransferase [Algoriphagus locisalis]
MSDRTTQEMDGKSLSPTEEKLKALREVLPEVFTENQIDWEKLKATLGENINFSNERYVLNWAGKSAAFKILQIPSTKTLVPAKDESVNFDETQNIFIEGENLEVLKVLQKSYFGKVKMIYIDPPYNTGNDSFIYPDKFSETKAEYEKRVGDKDEDGYMTKDGMFKKNSKENGQYHSNWLNMMMPRLYLAKNLLRQDGVICVSIDDNEVHNLRLLMNEVFGEENFVAEFIWKSRQNKDNRTVTGVSIDHEYILVFSKTNSLRHFIGTPRKTNSYTNPDNDPRGSWASSNMVGLKDEASRPNLHYDLINPKTSINYGRPKMGWRYDIKTMTKLISEDRIIWPESEEGRPRRKVFLSDISEVLPGFSSIVGNDLFTRDGTKEIDDLFDKRYFDFPKSSKLISDLINQTSGKSDLILDFFAGSCTTAQAVMELNRQDGGNRKYVCVQLPELCEEKSEAFKAGYFSIVDISKERIRRAGNKIQSEIDEEVNSLGQKIKKLEGEIPTDEAKTEIASLQEKIQSLQTQDLGFKVLKLDDSNFKQWKQLSGHNAQALAEQIKLFVDPVAETATEESMVYELLLKSGKDLNSQIEKRSDAYWINGKELVLILNKVPEDTIKEVIDAKPTKVIALDRIFKENDQLKTNTVLQMRDAGIEFKTI